MVGHAVSGVARVAKVTLGVPALSARHTSQEWPDRDTGER
jgi:hypothetical protein